MRQHFQNILIIDIIIVIALDNNRCNSIDESNKQGHYVMNHNFSLSFG